MEWNWKENKQQKHQFRSYYCSSCKQAKPCRTLYMAWEGYCCECYFKSEQVEAQKYSDYQSIYQQEVKKQQKKFQHLLLLKDYSGCPQCGSKEVVFIEWEEGRLVCQPCQVEKAQKNMKYDEKNGGWYYSVPGLVSFSKEAKAYKKWGKIDLAEWLTKFQGLPVNKECGEKWLKDSQHLSNCQCLEKEVQELMELYASSLKEKQELLKKCQCKKSEKTRTPYYDGANYGYAYCEKCETTIKGAGKMGIIKNRNDPKFWGLNITEKVLCLNCLQKFQEKMPISKRYTLNKYLKRGY